MIKFLKTRKVASPEREKGNAGFDFFVPEFTKEFMRDCALEAEKIPQAMCWFLEDNAGKLCITVDPHRRVSIPSGIKARIELDMPICSYNLGIDLVVENKSGVATKKGLDVAASEVDENYQGEIHLSVTNTTDEQVRIYPGDKIVQLVPRVYVTSAAKVYEKDEISEEEFWKDFPWNNRGSGAFGSTGEKAK